MKKELKKINKVGVHSGISGNINGISGDTSRISGNTSEISGDVSRISGDVSEISGNLDLCDITKEEREKGIDINELVGKD